MSYKDDLLTKKRYVLNEQSKMAVIVAKQLYTITRYRCFRKPRALLCQYILNHKLGEMHLRSEHYSFDHLLGDPPVGRLLNRTPTLLYVLI